MISAKIKMLEWHNFDAWTYWAEGACGTYHIEERNGYWQVELRVGGLVHGVTQTDGTTPAHLDAAKAAAQADYEARILAALEAAPVAPAEAEGHWEDFLKSAVAEAEKAMRKFPQPNYVISKVAEEAGEVVKAAIHCAEARETAENVRNEMRQLIAMLYRLWVEGDQVHGLPPVSTTALAASKEADHVTNADSQQKEGA